MPHRPRGARRSVRRSRPRRARAHRPRSRRVLARTPHLDRHPLRDRRARPRRGRARQSGRARGVRAPQLLVRPTALVVARARERGWRTRIVPGVSSVACLLAELAIDPGDAGLMVVEHGALLADPSMLRRSVPTVVMQVGKSSASTGFDHGAGDAPDLRALEAVIVAAHGPGHRVALLNAPTAVDPAGSTRWRATRELTRTYATTSRRERRSPTRWVTPRSGSPRRSRSTAIPRRRSPDVTTPSRRSTCPALRPGAGSARSSHVAAPPAPSTRHERSRSSRSRRCLPPCGASRVSST